MSFRSVLQRHWKVACVIVGCWTFLALLFTPQTYLANLRSPAPLTWGQALFASLTKLNAEKFVRVHRSVMVNVEKIKEIYPRSNGDQDLILQNGRQLMLSRNYRDKFFSLLGEL